MIAQKSLILTSFSDKKNIIRLHKKAILIAHIYKIFISSVNADQNDFRIISMISIQKLPADDRLFSSRRRNFYSDTKRELRALGLSIKESSAEAQTHPAGKYLVWTITQKKV